MDLTNSFGTIVFMFLILIVMAWFAIPGKTYKQIKQEHSVKVDLNQTMTKL